jgi:predicted porin
MLAALATLAATASFAQSTVELYGRMDVGYNQTKATASTTGASVSATLTNMVKEDGLSTGYLGVRGTEDLGGGMKAIFIHEMDLDMHVGALTTTAGRDSTLGLEGGFGKIRLGRSYTPLFSVLGASDPFGTTGAGTVNLTPTTNGARVSQAVFYTSPSFGGVTVDVAYAQNKATIAAATDISTTTADSTAVGTKNTTTGFNIKYANGPLMVALAYGQDKGLTNDAAALLIAAPFLSAAQATTAGTAAAANNAKYTGNALTATYDFGVAKAFFGHTTAKHQNDTTVDTYLKATETNFGLSVPMGAITLLGAVGQNTVQGTTASVAGGKYKGTDFAVGATYAFSKHTTAYAKTGTFNKYKLDDDSIKTTRSSIGLRHVF